MKEINTLVLSGGSVKGVAYIGIFKKIEEIIKENVNRESKIKYQINSNLAIYTILVLMLVKKFGSSYNLEYFSIIGYTIFLSAIKNGYTVDNIFTLILVFLIFYSNSFHFSN